MKKIYFKYYFGIMVCALTILMYTPNELFANNTERFYNSKVTISLTNASLRTVFDKIEDQTGLVFMYNSADVKSVQNVSLNVESRPVNEVLDVALKGSPLSYKVNDKYVVVSKAATKNVEVDQKTITGKVIDKAGNPISGVTVIIKNTSKGDITRDDGSYSLKVANGDVLSFTFMGYLPQDIALAPTQSVVNVVLEEDVVKVDEVVVVGYGTQKRVNLTGAISVVDESSIENRPLTNATQALQGVQGVYVNQSGGQPGRDGATIRVRGQGTLNDNNPLVIVDGIPSSLDDVNPNDIASMSVLKDAASSAIYGSRAANGVILVTTKKAQSGEFSVSYNNYFGVQKVTYLPDAVWDPIKVMDGWNTALDNNGQARIYSPEIIQEYKDGMAKDPYVYPATNWFDIAFNNAFVQEHNARISGGTEKLQLSFSLGYLDQDGVMIGTDSKKVTFNFNGVAQISKRFKAGMTASGTYTNFNELHYGTSLAMNYLMRSLPFMPKTLEDGRYGRAWLTTPGQNTFSSIYANAIEGSNNNKRTRFLANVFAEYTFPLDIVYKINLGVNKYDAIQRVFTPLIEQYNPKTNVVQYANNINKQSRSYDVNNIDPSVFQTLNWAKTFKEKHTLSAMFGVSYEEFNAYNFDGYSEGFLDNSLTDINAGSKNYMANGSGNVVKLMSYFGRINYDYKDKYLLEANFRVDGSSRFAPQNRYGFFPSFSAGWRIDQEKFMENAKWLSNLKLRGSWGQLGNQQIGIYQYVQTVSLGQDYPFGSNIASGGAVTGSVDPNITWEATTITNVGVDFGMFRNRLTGTVEFFKKRTNDILRTVNLPSQVGKLTGPTKNIGTVDNTGFEGALSWRDKVGDFNYQIGGSITYVKNQVVGLNGQEIYSGRHIIKEGYPIDSYYLYINDGIFQSNEEVANHPFQSNKTAAGDLKYVNVDDSDNVINEKDRVPMGNVIPKYTYSFNISADWKGLSLNAFFQGVAQVDTYPTANLATPYNNGAGVTYEWLENAWTPENRSTTHPRLMQSSNGHDNFGKPNSYWLRDASYLRLKNLQLSYTLPQRWSQALRTKNIRIFVNAENLWTISNFKIADPERTMKGGNLYEYPSVKSFTGGINLTF